jgi:hypothetical protein
MRTIVFDPSGLIVNIVSAEAGWNPADPLFQAVASQTGNIGDSYADGMVVPKVQVFSKQGLTRMADGLLDQAFRKTLTVSVGGGVNALVDTSAASRTDVLGLQTKIFLGETSVIWRQTGGAITLSADQLHTITVSLDSYVEAAYTVWQMAIDGINATPPTITQNSQISALPWPTT